MRKQIQRKQAQRKQELADQKKTRIDSAGSAMPAETWTRNDPFDVDRRLRRVSALVDHHFPKSISLSTAARAAGLEMHYFSVYFRRRTSQTFSEWRRAQKVHRAVALIATTDLSVTAIALRVGYRDATSLGRACKSVLRLTPRQVRSQIRSLPAPVPRGFF